jgi:hypothetical protein
MDDIRFYCGLNEINWNWHPAQPGAFACVSPVSGVKTKSINRVRVPSSTSIIQDSGAFCDSSIGVRGDAYGQSGRLTFQEALMRQEAHAERFGYADKIEARASYDLLIDEMWYEDESTGLLSRKKARWNENDAELAVKETVAAAKFLHEHRNGISCIQSAQGVSAKQYLRCVEQLLSYFQDGDILGLGGWCILGKVPSLVPSFWQTMSLVIPFLAAEGVERVHIWGCIYRPAIGNLLYLCDQYGLKLSADTAHPCYAPAWGNWGYGSWRAKQGEYQRAPVMESCTHKDIHDQNDPLCAPDTRCRGNERIRHTRLTREWLANFHERESAYCVPREAKKLEFQQLSLFVA